MKNSTWKPFCSATLAVAMLLYGPGIAGAENAATQSESTQKTDSDKQQQQEQAANQHAKPENTASSAAAPASEGKVPVAEVEVTAEKEKSADKPKDKLTIGQQPDAEGVKNYVITQSFESHPDCQSFTTTDTSPVSRGKILFLFYHPRNIYCVLFHYSLTPYISYSLSLPLLAISILLSTISSNPLIVISLPPNPPT